MSQSTQQNHKLEWYSTDHVDNAANGTDPSSRLGAVRNIATAQGDHGKTAHRSCPNCGLSFRLRTQPLGTLDHFAGTQRSQCDRCFLTRFRLRWSWTMVPRLLLVSLLLAAGCLLAFGHLPSRLAQRREVDSLVEARAVAGGQLTAFEQLMTKRPKTTMDNSAIIKMWQAQVDPYVIVQLVRTSIPDYDLSSDAIVALREAHVDREVILAMISTSYSPK